MEPLTPLRVPLIFNLRRDPYERSYRTSNTYYDWWMDRAFLIRAAQPIVGNFLQSFIKLDWYRPWRIYAKQSVVQI
jgi:arylsulfatase